MFARQERGPELSPQYPLKVGNGSTAHFLIPALREVRQEDLSGLLARYSINVFEISRPMRDLVRKLRH